jgi:molybdopterin-guanine dinucleotide biosynthesis protein A
MGQDKALLEVNGRPLLENLCLAASSVTDRVYVVTPWVERYQEIVPPQCGFVREFIPEGEGKPQGPLFGFVQGLARVETEWVLLLACDLPYLTARELKLWISYLPDVPKDMIALLPRGVKGWEPLAGFYRLISLTLLEDFIAGGGKSFQPWLKEQKVEELGISDRQVLFNCNTPEDFQRLISN